METSKTTTAWFEQSIGPFANPPIKNTRTRRPGVWIRARVSSFGGGFDLAGFELRAMFEFAIITRLSELE